MHALDIIIAVIGIVFVFIGIKRGLIGELIRLVAMVAGVFIAFIYYHDVARLHLISKLPVQQGVKRALAFLLIYIVCAALLIAVGWLIKKIVHLTPLGMIDRVLGATIGLLKTFLIAYVVCLSISTLPLIRLQSDFRHSIVYSSYKVLPKALTLKSLLKKRSQIRTMFKKEGTSAYTGKIQKKIETFKAAVDSAKEAQSKTDKE